ncbi:MAG: hypothetical protein QQW96_02010 [Tychonema bourrellyi B0820]|nr:hypothetical protein [Tychonema bourrellyi]MDQ2096414.1 hypothetical protein [Tychonema bourrellyi B0820]
MPFPYDNFGVVMRRHLECPLSGPYDRHREEIDRIIVSHQTE